LSVVDLHVLGSFRFRADPDVEPVRLSHRSQALLTCVVLAGEQGMSRQQLAALLWGDQADAAARNALRQALHRLRRELGAAATALVCTAERVGLSAAGWRIDLWCFEALSARADPASWLEALDHYGGELAADVEGGTEFSAWAAVERSRLRQRAQQLLALASERIELQAHLDTLLHRARMLLTADPLHEGSHCALIRLYARAGWRAKAAEAWLECRRVLRHEVGVEPSTATREMVECLLDPGAGSGVQAVAPVACLAHSSAIFARQRGPTLVLDLMLRGWQLFVLYTSGANRQAREVFAQVVDHEGEHAEALALIGFTHWLDAVNGWCSDVRGSLDATARFAERALACNRACATPHHLQGKLLLWQGRHAQALAALQRGMELAPTAGYAHFHLAEWAMWVGRGHEALAHMERALQLDANEHGVFFTIRGMAAWTLREYDAAADALQRALTRNPDYAWAHGALAAVLAECGAPSDARACADAAGRLNRRFSLDFAARALPFADDRLRQRLVLAWQAAGMPARERAAGTQP
jgi:DNA-binding SARP family transcriptional activator